MDHFGYFECNIVPPVSLWWWMVQGGYFGYKIGPLPLYLMHIVLQELISLYLMYVVLQEPISLLAMHINLCGFMSLNA